MIASLLVLSFVFVALSPTTPSAFAQTISCGSTITRSITLTSNIGPCTADDGLIIDANNINLNCNAHSIIGGSRNESSSNTNIFEGIKLIGHSGVTISNCMVTGFNGDGFYVQNATKSVLTHNTATRSGRDGFYIVTASKNTLNNNTVMGDNASGFGLSNSPNDSFDGNKATGNKDAGFLVFGSSNTTLTGNTATMNNGSGFEHSFSPHSSLTRNNAKNNQGRGFDVYGHSDNNILTRNTATRNNASGFGLNRVINNILTANTATMNNRSGFGLGPFFVDNTLTRNNATMNKLNGFSLDANETNNNLMRNNNANTNTGFGYSDASHGTRTAGTANTYRGNQCSSNLAGGSSPHGLCKPQR